MPPDSARGLEVHHCAACRSASRRVDWR